ncbi:MAG TPA: hypothetical protein VGG48_11275 [Rhizomicrobium sp.]
MTIRTLVLGSAASLTLALGFASASMAQDANNPPQYSTPAERQQTQQLNSQAQDGTTASPAQLNGDSNAPSGSAAQSQYNAQQTQYQQQQQQYQNQQQQYQNDRSRYHADHARYDHELRQYDTRQYAWEYPHRVYAYHYGEGPDLQRLYLIAQPAEQLASAPVEGPNGEWVGKVRNVDTGIDGRPFRIEIALNRRVSVWVPAGDFRFDPNDHILFTDMSREQLWDMPGATVESNAYYAP